jgi:hypothetical protein
MNSDSLKIDEAATEPDTTGEFKLTWRFVCVWAFTASTGAYLCFVLLLFGLLPSKGPAISFSDCLFYPVRRGEIRQKQGTYLIGRAHEEARMGRLNSAFLMFESGLAKNRGDWPARLEFSRLLLNVDLRESVRRLLEDGFDFSADEPRYIDGVLAIAAAARDHTLWAKACDAGLAAARLEKDGKERSLWLLEQKASGLLAAGLTREALAILPETGSGDGANQVLLRATILLQLKTPQAAVAVLTTRLEKNPSEPAILSLLAHAQRVAGDLSAMEATLAKALACAPPAPAAAIDLAANRALAGNSIGARAALDKFFLQFCGRPDDLLPVAQAMARISDAPLLAACIDESDRQGYAGIGLRELMVEVRASRGEWAAASALLRDISLRRSAFKLAAGQWQSFYERLTEAALKPNNETQAAFVKWIGDERPQAALLEKIIRQLAQAGRRHTAQSVAKIAQTRYPEARDWSAFARQYEAGAPVQLITPGKKA